MISVVIPNWNGVHHLDECLASLRRQTCRDFEVIVVDNGSTDDSVSFLRRTYPEVTVVELSSNRGFAAAVNTGINAARGEYIALLNNDTEADADWLMHLQDAFVSHPSVAICASMLANYYHRNVVDSAGDGMNLARGPYKIGEKEPTELYRAKRLIFGACGGGGCYRREVFQRIGFFDEDFFAYFEDSDLSFRANWAGLDCLFVPEAVIYHKVGGTSDSTSASRDRFDVLRRRNYIFLVIKNYPLSFLIRWLPAILLRHFLKFLHNIVRRRYRVAFLTQLEIMKGFPGMLRQRREIMKGRRISNGEMRDRCTPRPLPTATSGSANPGGGR